jgi:hypothetical protein
VLVAITSGKSLLGWIALPGTTVSDYGKLDVEQDLVLLGLHTGYLVRDAYKRRRAQATDTVATQGDTIASSATHPPGPPLARATSRGRPQASLQEGDRSERTRSSLVVDGELPKGVVVEDASAGVEGKSRGESRGRTRGRVYGLPRDRALIVQWTLRGRETDEEKLDELLARHADFFVASLRGRQDTPRLATLSLRLASDFASLFEGYPKLKAFDECALGFVLLDARAGTSIDGMFGDERFGFTGPSRVENEFLHEVAAVRGGDKLVYRERARVLQGQAGWMFALDEAACELLPGFARADFMERYLAALRSAGGLRVEVGKAESGALALALESRGESARGARCLCVFVVGDEEAGPGARVS